MRSPTAGLFVLVPDGEAVEFTRSGLCFITYVINVIPHPFTNRLYEPPKLLRFPFGDQMDSPIREIPDVAVYGELPRQLVSREPETNSLDVARVVDLST